ncbi:MAG TPA: GTP cyclohydrolase II [Candidatus Thermoplasmatota archaeon]|nr:GTP cyclohydrolase II [Candidatus Thermoplasmatota archaeon]
MLSNGARPTVPTAAAARLPTRHGEFEILAFEGPSGEEHVALLRGDVRGGDDILVRIHSQCLTGDVLGSLRCDCGAQLEASLCAIAANPRGGVLLYLQQEGRGIGLLNKIRAYRLQDGGLDTAEANEALGLPHDARDYAPAAAILQALDVKSVVLLTNNPRKVEGLEHHGIRVARREPLVSDATEHNGRYLEAKRVKLGHLF